MNWLRKTTAILAALALTACSAGYTTGNTASVLLIIAAINGGSPLQSDVFTDGSVLSNNVEIAIAVRFKNPNIETVPSIPNAVILERYSVKFVRSDGRGIEGVDVPYSFSGNITTAFDVKTSGTDPVAIEVVRAQAKLEPPLRNLRGISPGSLGGALVVTMFAEITLHGRTISGQAVSATGRLQVDFADYAD